MTIEYEGCGIYTAHLQSGKVQITPDEIFELMQEISKVETIPNTVEHFEYSTAWERLGKESIETVDAISALEDTDSKLEIDEEIDELIDKSITECQDIALNFYSDKYILLEKG